jgi:hypothetical protein
VFDRLVLTGSCHQRDIASDDRINIRARALQEGLRAALHAGRVFGERTLGVIRLYSRKPRVFEEGEKKLLQSLAAQAAAALEQSRLLALEQQEEATQRQLALAADVQRRMLPRTVPNFPRLDLAARYIPSYELGGDFYDFIELNGHMGLVVGDVVGKGIAAALLMASVRASLRAFTQDVYDLDEIVGRVNQSLARDTRTTVCSPWYGVSIPTACGDAARRGTADRGVAAIRGVPTPRTGRRRWAAWSRASIRRSSQRASLTPSATPSSTPTGLGREQLRRRAAGSAAS